MLIARLISRCVYIPNQIEQNINNIRQEYGEQWRNGSSNRDITNGDYLFNKAYIHFQIRG